MKSSEVLIYLALKYNGDWDSIFNAMNNHDQEHIEEKEALKCVKSLKSKAVTLLDDDYPQSLKTLNKPPFVLFYHGDISLAQNKRKCISVVGSRDNSYYGCCATQKLVKDLCKEMVIVSGMARGIDGIAHRACIENGGKTIVVLGCGINVCYPPKNLDIYDEARKNHLIISEYPDLTVPNPLAFPVRNRIIAALSDCLLITEGKMNSGTSITASLALENGACICCVPSLIGRDSICNHLIANGAALVETADDVFLEMGYKSEESIF